MAKLLAVALMALLGGGIMPSMGSASITISPSPPSRGDTVTLTCDGIPPGTTLKLDWNPSGSGPAELVVGEDGKASFVVSDNAEDVIITEPESGAEAATSITP